MYIVPHPSEAEAFVWKQKQKHETLFEGGGQFCLNVLVTPWSSVGPNQAQPASQQPAKILKLNSTRFVPLTENKWFILSHKF